jgi:signal transduction histidine kinase
MKLFTKYNRINIFATVGIFLLASGAFYFLLRYIIIDQVDQDLRIEENEIETSVKTFHKLPAVIPVHDQYTTFTPISSPSLYKKEFLTLKKYEAHEHEDILVRQIAFEINVGNQWYHVTVSKSLEGTEDLIQSIIVITICTVLSILVVTLLINRIVLKRLWQPFYDTLKRIGDFKLGSKQQLDFSTTNIEEFDLMNSTLQQSIGKAEQDYLLLREFTENASHELQTPLAIIRSKLDLLIQDENLSQRQSDAVQDAYDAIQRSTRINQSLLLLAKIENRQFAETISIDLKEIIKQKLKQFHELWQSKGITVSDNLQVANIIMNPMLADILLNNLFGNAIKHNVENGSIYINVSQGYFEMKNTGQSQSLDPARLFSRFYKSNTSAENHGLGLSIIKQICEVSGCVIEYCFEAENVHSFIIRW